MCFLFCSSCKYLVRSVNNQEMHQHIPHDVTCKEDIYDESEDFVKTEYTISEPSSDFLAVAERVEAPDLNRVNSQKFTIITTPSTQNVSSSQQSFYIVTVPSSSTSFNPVAKVKSENPTLMVTPQTVPNMNIIPQKVPYINKQILQNKKYNLVMSPQGAIMAIPQLNIISTPANYVPTKSCNVDAVSQLNAPKAITQKLKISPLEKLNKFYQCDFCIKSFVLKKCYVDHLTVHACKICEELFKPGDLQVHMMTTHSTKESEVVQKVANEKYPCNLCSSVLANKRNYDRHMLCVHSDKRPYACEICAKPFKLYETMKYHMRIHNDEERFKCEICNKTFKHKYYLKIHNVTKHQKSPKYFCDLCNLAFAYISHYNSHLNTRHRKVFKCKICNEKFSSDYYYRKHYRTVHQGIVTKKHYTCTICQKSFAARAYMQKHLLSHGTKKQQYMCDECGKVMTTEASLHNHKLQHTGIKSFQCHDCGKMFLNMKNLRNHARVHTGEKRYTCKMCKKKFTQRSTLVIHMRNHTGERPYKCNLCKNGFVSRHALNTHKRNKHKIAD